MEKMEKQISDVHKEDFRLNKYLAHCGVASRRTADELIRQGRVQINGKTVTELGTKIHPDTDTVTVDGERIRLPEKHTYILLNKPKDCITTASDERGRRTVLDLVPDSVRFFPVGRLDRNTTGVLLLTNDGDLAHRLMHPRYGVEKAYIARLDKPLEEKDRKRLLRGVRIEGKPAKAEEVTVIEGSKRREIGIVLHEGRNKQVHRMFEAIRYDVKSLDRVAYAGLTHAGLQKGEWRYLTKREVAALRTLARFE
jgi:pseudouridine synthase